MAIRFWELYEETKEQFHLKLLAGKSGMDHVVGWVHMVEDETIVSRFTGEELAVTTGIQLAATAAAAAAPGAPRQSAADDWLNSMHAMFPYLEGENPYESEEDPRLGEDRGSADHNADHFSESGLQASSFSASWLLDLIIAMKRKDSAGIIVNTGMYIKEIPDEVVDWCNENSFPLLTMPWEIHVTSLVQDFCMRIISRDQKDKENGALFRDMMRGKEVPEEFLSRIEHQYHLEGTFRVFCLYVRFQSGLASASLPDGTVDTDEEALFHRCLLKLENTLGIWKDGRKVRFPYFLMELDEYCVLTVNDLPDSGLSELTEQIRSQFAVFDLDGRFHLGIGPAMPGIQNLRRAFRRARSAVKMALQTKKPAVNFDDMGFYSILFSCEDPDLLKVYEENYLGPLYEYDRAHGSDYATILESYIRNDRSLQAVAAETFIHRNTVSYRLANIREILGCELRTPEELFPYEVAYCIHSVIG